ncbi:organic cation transporter protein isoform X2 [Nematostella vectensis]|nr:organic cation transporter protein isoform X2 [Nematostella vectensis]XP_032230208.2 organic cation transporter protein isoform X2 [Nematostella vectensis]XP_048583464.1 organic cation transporter protein isoform X2 [Nematostella vectensis]
MTEVNTQENISETTPIDSPSPGTVSKFDDVFQYVNSFGFYQRILYVGVNLLVVPLSLQFALLVFAMGTPNFHCSDENSTCPQSKCCDNCTSYTFDGPFTSIVSEWNLICDNAHKGAAVQSCFFAGMLVGSMVGGWASDRFGRRLCLLVGSAIMLILSFGTAFADCLSLLAFLRFGVGVAHVSVMVCQYVYVIELVGPKTRTMSGKVQDLFWDIGDVMTFVCAYFIREWRMLILCCTLFFVPFFLFWRVFPDTARWLISQGRQDQAREVLIKYGGKKKTPLDSDHLKAMIESIYSEEKKELEYLNGKNHTALDLFRTPKLRKLTLILCFNWFVISLVSFGMYLYITALAGNLYVNYLVMALLSMPQLLFSWFLMQKFGRIFPFMGYMLLAGVLCLVVMGIPKEYSAVVTGLTIFGMSLVSCAFNNIYLLSSEQFPTVVRNIGMGTGSMCARVGAILSPFLVMLAQLQGFSLTFPVSIFGVLAVLAAFSSLWLPETLNTSLPQTIDELEKSPGHVWISCFKLRSNKPLVQADGGNADVA